MQNHKIFNYQVYILISLYLAGIFSKDKIRIVDTIAGNNKTK